MKGRNVSTTTLKFKFYKSKTLNPYYYLCIYNRVNYIQTQPVNRFICPYGNRFVTQPPL